MQDWGFEVTMGVLLIAAFLAMNVYSLVYMLFIALGMSLPAKARRRCWRYAVLPLLGLILIWQYAVSVGWPPFANTEPGQQLKRLLQKCLAHPCDLYLLPHFFWAALRHAECPG